MKNLKNVFFLFFLTVFAFSCEKHVVEYDSETITNQAEFQLHYFVPVTSGSANNITKIELNGEWISKDATLTTYNAVPSGGIGRFFVTKKGTNNIKLYKGDAMDLVYDQNVELTYDKQNVFVYDFDEPPIVIENGYPYTAEVTEYTGTTAWIKFYNFLFETDGVPTDLTLQYQCQYVINDTTKQKSDWVNVGKPVAFGEATGWEEVHVNISTTSITSGNDRVDYRIMVVDNSGNSTGLLQVLNSSGKMVDYSDWWTAYSGRRYHHIFSGLRLAKPLSGVRQFTAL